MTDMELILASGSPRRRELLDTMGVAFTVHEPNINETRRDDELAEDYVTRMAREKARAVYAELNAPQYAILAADTIVVQAERIHGKPRDFAHAQQIWQSLSAAKHQVMTAVCLMVHDKLSVKLGLTEVEFATITDAQMHTYWGSNEPQDKAGGYAIQGFASAWVKSIHGSYSNVVGLPLREVNELLGTINMNWL